MTENGNKELESILAQILAVEVLEYHDKNLLGGSNKSRCEWRQEQLSRALKVLSGLICFSPEVRT